MARPRKNNITIDEEIIKQEEQVSKSKAKYDADVKKLKDLYAKKDEMKKRELLEAVEKSSKTFEEIMGFLKGDKYSCTLSITILIRIQFPKKRVRFISMNHGL